MIENRNILYYLIAIVIFILLKFGFTIANNDDLLFLLKPTDKLVGLLTGTNSIYSSDKGYFCNTLNVLIDKSCAGFNFWLLSFLMLTFLGLKYSYNKFKRIFVIPLALIGAYFFTIFANTSRIFVSIVIQNQTNNIIKNQQHNIHELLGIITNLSFLILLYFLTNKILKKRNHYAKLTQS
jgi:exosortase K